jgi:hypothetical protein
MERRYGSALSLPTIGQGDSAGAMTTPRVFKEGWVARTLVAANISSARCAGVPKMPNPPKVERLPGSRIMSQTVLLVGATDARRSDPAPMGQRSFVRVVPPQELPVDGKFRMLDTEAALARDNGLANAVDASAARWDRPKASPSLHSAPGNPLGPRCHAERGLAQ